MPTQPRTHRRIVQTNNAGQRRNQYGGECVDCGEMVIEMQGNIQRTGPFYNEQRRWELRHDSCSSVQATGGRVPTTNMCCVSGCSRTALANSVRCEWHPLNPIVSTQPAASFNTRSGFDLTSLPAPSRNRLHVYGVEGSNITFRIIRQGIRTTVYGSRNGSDRYFPDAVAVQRDGEADAMWYSNGMLSIYNDSLREVMANPTAALERWGRIIGSCGHCGRRLTNPESVARGIGPVCYARTLTHRWSYGVAAEISDAHQLMEVARLQRQRDRQHAEEALRMRRLSAQRVQDADFVHSVNRRETVMPAPVQGTLLMDELVGSEVR